MASKVISPRAISGISALASLVSSIVVAWLLIWPWARNANIELALLWLLTPHLFLRFIGGSFLVPGVAGASLPRSWAVPAAFGDLIAGVLAIISVVALVRTAPWAIGAVWVFNVWGLADLLYAGYKGARVNLEPGSLGAGYYIVTAIVPPLTVSHILIFMLLLRGGA